MAPAGDPGAVEVYSAQGAFQGRVGGRGSGPGEFAAPLGALQGVGDSVHVFDRQLRRWSVLSPDLRFVRSTALPLSVQRILGLGSDGSLYVNGAGPTPRSTGLPVHQIGSTGNLIASFGDTESTNRPGTHPGLGLREGGLGRRTVFVTRPHRFSVEEWTARGVLVRTLRARPTWFKDWVPSVEDDRAVPMMLHPGVVGLRVAGDSLLWVYSIRPTAASKGRWMPPEWKGAVSGGERPRFSLAAMLANYETVLDVIDLRRDTVAASFGFDGAYLPSSRAEWAFRLAESADGLEELEVVRLAYGCAGDSGRIGPGRRPTSPPRPR
ncbi:MAG: hypothetical protein AB7L66_04485 [Gemmatimonadales bacterium]